MINFAIAQHYENMDKAAEELAEMVAEGANLYDEVLYNRLLRKYGLDSDGFTPDRQYIIKEAIRRI